MMLDSTPVSGGFMIKNILDEQTIAGGDDLSFFGVTLHEVNPPRWYGLTFRYNFGL